MKIAFILSNCSNTGPFIVAKNIIDNIFTMVDVIDVYYISETPEKLEFKATCIKVNLFEKTDFSKYDVVHSHGFLGDMYSYLSRKTITGKRITTLHQQIKTDYSMNYNRLIGFVLEKVWCFLIKDSSLIVTLTDEMTKYYRNKFSLPITHVYNGIPLLASHSLIQAEDLEKILLLKSKYLVIGICSNLIYRKGLDIVINALTLDNGQKLALLVIGDGKKKKELLSLADKLGVSNRCLFLGYKKNAIAYNKYFDVYMMSSRSEGFGLCVIEAASQKLPIVCNDLPVYKELFTDEVVRFKLEDNLSLIKAIDYAVANRDVLSRKIYEKFIQTFTSEKMANSYLDIYEKI